MLQVIGTGPHRLNKPSRPDWFFRKAQYGGILCDIGSHQIEQFLYYSGNTDAKVVHSKVANYGNPDVPELEDLGNSDTYWRQWSNELFSRRLVYAVRSRNLGRRPDDYTRNGWLHRAAQIYRCCSRQAGGSRVFGQPGRGAAFCGERSGRFPFLR